MDTSAASVKSTALSSLAIPSPDCRTSAAHLLLNDATFLTRHGDTSSLGWVHLLHCRSPSCPPRPSFSSPALAPLIADFRSLLECCSALLFVSPLVLRSSCDAFLAFGLIIILLARPHLYSSSLPEYQYSQGCCSYALFSSFKPWSSHLLLALLSPNLSSKMGRRVPRAAHSLPKVRLRTQA